MAIQGGHLLQMAPNDVGSKPAASFIGFVQLPDRVWIFLFVYCEGPEGVKWELGFGQMFTEVVGFGSLGLGFGNWEWESQTEKQ